MSRHSVLRFFARRHALREEQQSAQQPGPSPFVRGYARVIDLRLALSRSRRERDSVWDALAADGRAVGLDMWHAVERAERETGVSWADACAHALSRELPR